MIFETFLKPGEHPLAALMRARGQAQGALAEVADFSEFANPESPFNPWWSTWITQVTPTLYPGWQLLRVWVDFPDDVSESVMLVLSLQDEEEESRDADRVSL